MRCVRKIRCLFIDLPNLLVSCPVSGVDIDYWMGVTGILFVNFMCTAASDGKLKQYICFNSMFSFTLLLYFFSVFLVLLCGFSICYF